MTSLPRNLTAGILVCLILAVFILTQSGKTQTIKKKVTSQDVVTAVRTGGLREAARLTGNYVNSERSSGWTKYDLENLTKNSVAVAIGTPVLNNSKLSDSGEQVLTEHNVRIEQTLKGKLRPNQVINLTVIGGKVVFEDGTSAEIRTPDLGPIEVGKSYIFFMTSDDKDSEVFKLTGGGQGLFEIASDSTIEPRGHKVDVVRKHKSQNATAFVEEIRATVKKYPDTSRCCK